MTKIVKKSYDVGVFVFRRDLRLDDNLGLIDMLNSCDRVLPLFCLDPLQILLNDRNKEYFSTHAVQFMCESLNDLNAQLNQRDSKLFMMHALPKDAIHAVLQTLKQSKFSRIAVGWNNDYSEYSQKRDAEMTAVCKESKVDTMINLADYTLRPIAEYARANGEGFKKFSSFWQTAASQKPEEPKKCEGKFVESFTIPDEFTKPLTFFYTENPKLAQRGGTTEGQRRLSTLGKFKDYNDKRDFLSFNPTNLSAALNFGCISVRQAYYAIKEHLGNSTDLIKQLYWRDYHHSIAYYLPHALSYKRMIDPRFDSIAWKDNKEDWEKLMEAKTGFLLIDAAIEQMKQTGYVPNRARMLLGMMWTKFMRIHIYHPSYGLQVGFSKYLVDAVGPTQNKLNCAWIIELDFAGRRYAPPGAACAGRPMDISNKQIKKWDADGKYIKQWLPHLKAVPVEALVDWSEGVAKRYKNIHPAPIFDAKQRLDEWVEACRGL